MKDSNWKLRKTTLETAIESLLKYPRIETFDCVKLLAMLKPIILSDLAV